MILNCMAVDDEPLALKLVCTFIEQTPFLRLVGRYSRAVEALRGLSQNPDVDVLFLDIQMPDLNGLELARILDRGPGGRGPRIIFTTAFNQFALDGFRVDALDYLLKPFDYDEFLRAASKAKAYAELLRPQPPALPVSAEAPASPAASPDGPEQYLYLKADYQMVRIEFSDILYIEGLKDYIKVYRRSEAKPLLSLSSLKVMEDRLPAQQFMRIHRSFIVSLHQIKSITRGTVQIGTINIPVTDKYRELFDQFLGRWK